MTTFEIYFHGLVCFFADQPRHGDRLAPKTQALFVNDGDDLNDGHHLRAVITPDEMVHFHGFTSIAMEVTDGVPGEIDASDAGFQNDVPHLSEDAISRRGIFVDPAMAIALKFPPIKGVLQVAERYRHTANYLLGPNNTKRASARISVLKFEAKGLAIICDGVRIEVPESDPWIVMMNSSDHGGVSTVSDVCANHFRRYSFIMRNATGGVSCSTISDVVDLDRENVEDTPNGDHIERVRNLPILKSEIAVRQPVPPKPSPGDPGHFIFVARIGHDFDREPEVLTQTQCSNSNWP